MIYNFQCPTFSQRILFTSSCSLPKCCQPSASCTFEGVSFSVWQRLSSMLCLATFYDNAPSVFMATLTTAAKRAVTSEGAPQNRTSERGMGGEEEEEEEEG